MTIKDDHVHVDEGRGRSASDRGGGAGGAPVARWVHRRPGGTDPEDRAALLFRRVPVVPGVAFGPQAHARVRARLAAELGDAPAAAVLATTLGRLRRVRAPALRWGIAAGLLLGSGVVIAARGVDHWWNRGVSMASAPVSSGEKVARQRSARGAHRRDAVNGAAALAPSLDQTPVQAAVAPAVASTPVSESPLAAEAKQLNGAISRLRRDRDASGALADLAEYRRRFPNGTLTTEADTVRIDALLMLGRQDEALAALSALPLDGSGREQELRVIRGELRATSDCARALADFDQVRSPAASPELVERALFGSAVCLSRQGRQVEARREAERYIGRFPRGRFAREARRLSAPGGSDVTGTEPKQPIP